MPPRPSLDLKKQSPYARLWTIGGVKSAYLWDIFCKVIDNFGDIGVCWRLAADLASRGQQVRLWVDQPAALAWMAPGALERRWPRIRVLAWGDVHNSATVAALAPSDAWIEGFGCEVPVALQQHRFHPARASAEGANTGPIWINLEYLTAEGFAERNHGLRSPPIQGPAGGRTRFFFYPGFSARTGGLLREPDLAVRQAGFDRAAWLADQGIAWHGERLVSLFCYEPAALVDLLEHLRQHAKPTRLLVTHGRAAAAVRHLLDHPNSDSRPCCISASESLSLTFLPPLSQIDFDHLLWACDLNFVRGEDSVVRAIWAGKPLVWQIYPQHDDAHHAKLQAFLDAMDGPPAWRNFHLAWNGIVRENLREPDLDQWGAAALKARDRLLQQRDLTTRLLEFVETARREPCFRAEKR